MGPVAVPAGAGGRGFTPEQVADRALAGVQAGDFYIFSHHCNTSDDRVANESAISHNRQADIS